MQDLISVIVPVYKVEDYLPRCIDSILNQTYTNLEIILVDDGSPDNCPKICDEYAKKDKRVKVIHQQNSGLSAARNAGIDNANGNYIAFVDSDDFVHPKMYEVLVRNLAEHNAEMSICMYKRVNNSLINDIDINKQRLIICTQEETYNNLYNELYVPTEIACNKIYKKKVWHDIKYPVGKLHEDEFVIHHLISKCKTIVYTNLELYYYYNRTNSITKTFNIKRLDAIEAMKDRMDFFKQNGSVELYNKSYISYLKVIGLCYINMVNDKRYVKEAHKMKRQFNMEYKKCKKNLNINLKEKLQFILMFYFPLIYMFMKKLLRGDAS